MEKETESVESAGKAKATESAESAGNNEKTGNTENTKKKGRKRLTAVCFTAKKLSKTTLTSEICAQSSGEELRAELQQCIREGGKVYLFMAQSRPVGYLMFEKKKATVPDTAEEGASESEVTAYCLKQGFLSEGYETEREEAEKFVLEEMKEYARWNGCKAILWGDQMYRLQKTKWSMNTGAGMGIGLALGLVYGLLLNNLGLGICFGICFGTCFGVTWTQIQKKR